MYSANFEGIRRNKYVKLEGLKMLIIGPVFTSFSLFLSYISMSKWLAYFYFTSPFFLVMMIILFIYAPIRMIARQRKTLRELIINENSVTMITFNILWLSEITRVAAIEKMTIKKRIFSGFGPKAKQGLLIKLTSGEEFYLIEDYFDDYRVICEKLETNLC